KTVKDSTLLLKIIAGQDSRDSTCIPEPTPDYPSKLTESIKGIRIGIPKEYMIGGLDPDVKNAINQAIKSLENLGAIIEEISLPHTEYAIATYYIIATAEASANLARFDGVRYGLRVDGSDPTEMYCNTRGSGFGQEVKRRILLGTYVLSSGYYDAYYLYAQKVRTLIRRDFDNAFKKVDLIAAPTNPTAAFKLGEKSADPLQMYLSDIFTISCNLAGICGISVPCGFTNTAPRLPIGLQLLGKPMDEEKLLRTSYCFERAHEFYKQKPVISGE
ncbi:MAG TPA: amidase family protein, partial [Verrucomicrobiota bacterium]|nr:amidase family protein [Verrucomicrobiota bacterium]